MAWRMPFLSLDLVHTAIIGVDNHLKCIQDELQKIVYIFGHVADVEGNRDLKMSLEKRVLAELESLQGPDNRNPETVLRALGRII